MNPFPNSEIPQRQQDRRQHVTDPSTGISRSGPITAIGSIGIWIAAANNWVLVPK
jgi:hypothetical protein